MLMILMLSVHGRVEIVEIAKWLIVSYLIEKYWVRLLSAFGSVQRLMITDEPQSKSGVLVTPRWRHS